MLRPATELLTTVTLLLNTEANWVPQPPPSQPEPDMVESPAIQTVILPLLPPMVAAFAGTTGELVLPVLLLLGLAGRFAALGLSVMNVVAVISLAEIAPAALQQHQLWGSLLIGLALWGPGRWSLDRVLEPRLMKA